MDLNGDGHLDLISGSWPGELFFFRGGPNRTFATPEMLKDKDGRIINIGGGVKKQSDGSLLIYGNAEFEQTDEGTVVVYQGERLESTPERLISVTGTASAVHAADWDGDGDFDLLVGDIGGNIYLVPNEGTAQDYAFGKERKLKAGDQLLQVGGDGGPFAADWDGDGDLDLLVGDGNGAVWLCRNEGTAKEPKLAKAETLVPAGESRFGSEAPTEPVRGTRAKVCAADWNGDGRLDLLVGDFSTQKPNRPEPTAEEKARHDKLREEMNELRKQYSKLIPKLYGENRVRDKEEFKKVQEEMKTVRERMLPLYEQLPPEYENHGWVWLFVRQPE